MYFDGTVHDYIHVCTRPLTVSKIFRTETLKNKIISKQLQLYTYVFNMSTPLTLIHTEILK